jgi:dTMP kinase
VSTAAKGLFISFEGIDGSGKSTQTKLLKDRLEADGHQVVLTREPGGSAGAEETEILLFTAARRDHLERTILPALEAGKIVICDRFADSTRMYQGLSRGDLRGAVDQLHSLMIGVEPDVTVLIDMDPGEGLSRALSRNTVEERFEDFGESLQVAMRAGFLSLAAEFPDRFVTINGAQSIDAVAADVFAQVRPRLDAR